VKTEILRNRRRMLLGLGGLVAAPAAWAAQNTKPPEKEKKLSKGEKEAKKLLLLMDTDKNGMVSKAEFMAFMEAEFDRLDKDKSGELDVKELTEAKIRTNAAVHGR